MRRSRVIAGLVVLAVGVAVVALWPRGPTESEQRNMRVLLAAQNIQVGMTAREVEQLLQCPPDERVEGGVIERWTTRSHIGHTVSVWYVNGKVSRVEGRTWRSKPAPSGWDRLRSRLGL